MPNKWSRGTDFSIRTEQPWQIRFLAYLLITSFWFLVGVAINEPRSYTLTSAILKVDIICDVTMTSPHNVLITVTWLPIQPTYWQHVLFSFFIYPTGWIRVCKIGFVSIGENRGKPLVCKKKSLVNTNFTLRLSMQSVQIAEGAFGDVLHLIDTKHKENTINTLFQRSQKICPRHREEEKSVIVL